MHLIWRWGFLRDVSSGDEGTGKRKMYTNTVIANPKNAGGQDGLGLRLGDKTPQFKRFGCGLSVVALLHGKVVWPGKLCHDSRFDKTLCDKQCAACVPSDLGHYCHRNIPKHLPLCAQKCVVNRYSC